MNIYDIQQFIRIKNYYPKVNRTGILYLLRIIKAEKFPVVLNAFPMAPILLKVNSSLNRLYPKATWRNFPPVYIHIYSYVMTNW